MASAMTVAVNITGSSTGLTSAVKSSNTALGSLGGSATKAQGPLKALSGMGTALKTGLALGAVAAAKALFDMGAESQQITAQLEARLTALGSRTTITMGQLNDLATSIQNYSGISDEAVGASQAMLLTFGNIAADPAIFERATVAVADMATAMNNGATPSMEQMSKTSIMLGKALQDPVSGATALGKAGVDKAVIAQAQAMAKAGDVIGAQTMLLDELSGAQGEFAGSAAAMGTTLTGQWNIIKENVASAIEGIVVGLMKIVTPVAQVVGAILKFASATGLLQPLVAVIAVLAVAWGVYAIAQSAAVASVLAFWAAWGPVTAIVAGVVIVVAGFIKLVQAGLSALSGGWSKMGGVMKAVLIVTAPLWLPIVAAIKLVQAVLGFLWGVIQKVGAAFMTALKPVGAVIGFIGKMLGESIAWLANAAGAVASWIAEFAKGIPIVGDVIELVNVIGETSKANAMAASADMRTFGLSAVLAFQQGAAASVDMGKNIAVMRQALQATDPAAWSAQFQAGLTSVDNALKSGTLSAADAQKGYLAWGLSLQEAQKRAGGITATLNQTSAAMAKSGQISFQTADVMGRAWESVGPKVAGSLKAITKAITSSLQAELHLQKNTSTVTDRLINDYGLTADQAERTLAGASPKAMATMAKASDKEFRKTGTAIQKVNHIIPSVAKNFEGAGKAVDGTSKAATGAAKSATTLAKGTEGVSKSAQGATKGTESLGKSASKTGSELKQTGSAGSSAAKGLSAVGSSAQSGQSKISGMTTQVSRLKSELNGLPRNITIQVTVNIKKTGQSLGGVVPGLARGGVTTQTNGLPLTMVGEHGPELAALPPGTRVFSHNDTAGMLADAANNQGGGGGQMSISGKLTMVNGEAYIEGIVLDTLEDGRVVDHALTRRMRRP